MSAPDVDPSNPGVFRPGAAAASVPRLGRMSPRAGDLRHRSAAGLPDALIMMVDDEPLNIEMTGSFLMEAGYRHFVATHEPELAIGMMLDSGPSLVLLDLSMPKVSGMEILRAMRDDPALCHVPVIIMTGSMDPQARIDALAAGAGDFLNKPVDPTELALRVRNILAATMYRDYLAHHDALTGLPGSALYREAVQAALSAASESNGEGGLVHVGVHQLGLVSDALGRAGVDALLRRLASRLGQCVATPTPATASANSLPVDDAHPLAQSLFYLDNGSFSVLVPSASRATLSDLAVRLLEAASIDLRYAGMPATTIGCAIGVAVFPDDGNDAGTLIDNASTALRQALRAGVNECEFFKPAFRELAAAKLAQGTRQEGVAQAQPAPVGLEGQAETLDAAPWQDAIFDALPARVAVLDPRGRIVKVNRAWAELHIPQPGEGVDYALLCESFGQSPFLTRRMTTGVRRVLQAEAAGFREEYAHGGTGKWFELLAVPLSQSSMRGALLVLDDVTDRREAEEAQRQDRQLLDNIVDNIPTAVQIRAVADELRIVLWNKAAEAIYGIDRTQAVGSTVHDLWPVEASATMAAADLELLQRGGQQDFADHLAHTWLDRDIHLHMRKVPLYDSEGTATHLLVIADDITSQLEREAALRESEERFRSLVAMSSDWYWQQDEHFRFVFFSGDDDSSEVPFRSTTLGRTAWELPHRHPLVGTWDDHRATLEQHLPFKAFDYCYEPPGEAPAYTSVNGEPTYNSDGVFTGYRGTATDITAAKAAALEIMSLNARLEERVKQRTRQLELANSELQAFAYSVAHDIRGPLITLSGFTHMIERSRGPSPQEEARRTHAVARIRSVVQHMDELTGGLLSLAQLARVGMRWLPADIGELATKVYERLAETDKARTVAFNVEQGMVAPCDAVLMTQLLQNLIGNAWKFTARQPQARIAVGSEPNEQGGVRYFVRDNGAGFDAAKATMLFSAFQRFHKAEEFPGSGVGLATVHRIVTRHGGRVWAQSAPGEGATFYFTLGDAAAA
jgi:PAS domain S-box-containing protein